MFATFQFRFLLSYILLSINSSIKMNVTVSIPVLCDYETRTYDGRLKNSWTHLITPFTFSRSGWSVVRSASLAKGGTSKKRPPPHFQKVSTRSNEVSPRTLQTALVVAPS
jgi:hypothetical protein